MPRSVDDILRDLALCSPDERREVFQRLRHEFPIHPLEVTFGCSAEIILEAINRAPDLTQRGVRGVIAEAQFGTLVVNALAGWQASDLVGDLAYDFELTDSSGPVRVQVKNQRKELGVPLEHYGYYVVETQKTRGGTDASGAGTRLYRFGEFDIIAACMEPSTKHWSDFMYSVGNWMIPRLDDPTRLNVFQYIPKQPNQDWTSDFSQAVSWFRSGVKKTIYQPVAPPRTSKQKRSK